MDKTAKAKWAYRWAMFKYIVWLVFMVIFAFVAMLVNNVFTFVVSVIETVFRIVASDIEGWGELYAIERDKWIQHAKEQVKEKSKYPLASVIRI